MRQLQIELKWAVIFFIASLIWMLLEHLVGLHDKYIAVHAIYTNFFALVAITIYALAMLNKRNQFYQGLMTYWQGLKTGLIMTLLIVILVPLAQYITHTFITPEYFANVAELAVANNQLTQIEADAYFSLAQYIQLSVIMAAVMGVVTSLVVAFFTRSR